ncbi:MAG TPA: pseudouridine synthase [Verrucomicrobiae bacterium]|nr:pseudouridine synthase [Verrucomicrobiae bacterium]
MRLNKYLALATGMSRRAADTAIANGRVKLGSQHAELGQRVQEGQTVTLDDQPLAIPEHTTTIMLHKPVGFVCSRDGQGSQTIYNLLPPDYQRLKPVGRLDKDSSGLLLLTNDGRLAQDLTHPSHQKTKIYEVQLNQEPTKADLTKLMTTGVMLDDGPSSFEARVIKGSSLKVTMHEGRNRQIRRTFAALGYKVFKLHRTHFGSYALGALASGKTTSV